MSDAPAVIGCSAGCGAKWPADTIESSGWDTLQITGRFRCGACGLALLAAGTMNGAPWREDVDMLPPNSIGALKQLPEPLELREKVKL